MATIAERSFQIWPLLVFAAANRRILTYKEVSHCTGMAAPGLGACLDPIAQYCLNAKLPALTILVVSSETGLPGTGFHSIDVRSPEELAKEFQRVFTYDWSLHSFKIESFLKS
ncbi:MAG TPA: hypothetical protein VK171_04290 [Fimbriimonas sp.]|nr:hypothetical protein [Fimbriimonas sp.]